MSNLLVYITIHTVPKSAKFIVKLVMSTELSIPKENTHYQQSSVNPTLIDVYEGSRTSEKCSFLIAIKFKAMSPVKISDDF